MKISHIIAALIIATSCAIAITVEDLARYHGVSSWTTKVLLPPASFVAEVYTIKDGVADKRIIEGMPAWNKMPEKGITVMIGKENKKYRIVLAYGGGVTMTASSDITTFSSTLSPSLPDTIAEGDYILLGRPKSEGKSSVAEDIATYKEGFLLRIRKKN